MDLNTEKNNYTDCAPICKGNGEMTEVWETLTGVLHMVKLKRKVRPLSI